MEIKKINPADINGWGIDADPENEPTYPIKNYTGDDHQRINWERPTLQPPSIELLKSNERPSPSAVFGTSCPPSGLSGMLRRYAFRHSENRYRHWLPLLLADRVNVIEGVINDVIHGHITNIIKEEGWNAQWKYDKGELIRKVTVRLLVISAVTALIVYSGKNKRI